MPVLLLSLPADLVDNIASNLSYASTVALRLTCRELYNSIQDPNTSERFQQAESHKQKPYRMTDLLEIEIWPCYNSAPYREEYLRQPAAGSDFFACQFCLKIRSAKHFSNAMMKSKRGKLSPVPTNERQRRICITCGVTSNRFSPGTFIQFGGMRGGYGVLCIACKKFKELESSFPNEIKECDACCVARYGKSREELGAKFRRKYPEIFGPSFAL